MAWPTALPLIAILRGITPEDVVEHVEALLQEGFDAIEIPLNSPDWEKSIPLAVRQAGDRALVGAGTVLSVELASRVADLGGTLMVTPNTDPDVIRQARRRGLYTAIGFMTPSEAFAALATAFAQTEGEVRDVRA